MSRVFRLLVGGLFFSRSSAGPRPIEKETRKKEEGDFSVDVSLRGPGRGEKKKKGERGRNVVIPLYPRHA